MVKNKKAMSLIDQVYERIEESVACVDYNESDSEIAQYFAGRTLFITGVTGFLGKCMLDKLLKSCTKIKHIYILMRENKKETLEERTNKFFQHEIFDGLKSKFRDFRNKVTVIKGDLTIEGLGLSADDRNRIINEVNVIYHNAANVQFNEKVRISLRVNVLGTKSMLDLAQECKHLDVFVYVSTAYSHCYRKDIEEECYPFAADIKAIYAAIEADEKTESGLGEDDFKLLLGRHPNIYTYTKAFAEDLVRQYAQSAKFAHVIFRPSIVIAPYKEPLPGWYDNTLGPVLVFLAGPMGIAHVGYYKDYPLDCVPCDLSVNALFVITRDAYDRREKGERQAFVYNYGSSTTNPATLRDGNEYYKSTPLSERPMRAVWKEFVILVRQYWLFITMHYLFHLIPACIVDLVFLLRGKEPRLVSIFWKVTKYLDIMDYFGNGNWRINMPKTLEAIDKLNPADRQIFYSDIRTLSWEEYTSYTWRGLKKYILKEPITSEIARRRHIRLWYMHYGLVMICAFGVSYYLISKVIAAIF